MMMQTIALRCSLIAFFSSFCLNTALLLNHKSTKQKILRVQICQVKL